jgi:hypothetical protein
VKPYRKKIIVLTTKDSYTCKITHSTESTAVWNLKPERWISALAEGENYQGEKACDRRLHNVNNNNNNNNKWITMQGRRGVV